MQVGQAEWVTPQIRRVLAPNPSPMTGPGTNSYVLGRGRGLVLVDPGPDDPRHRAALLAALDRGETLGAIVVTHAHRDHSEAAAGLAQALSAPILAFGEASSGRSPLMQRLADAGLEGGGEGLDHAFVPDQRVVDGDSLPCPGGALRVIHTPGHLGGHICLAYGDVLLSGDMAMGWSSSIVSPPDGDMGAYMRSLARLQTGRWRLMLPGHGAAVTEVADRLAALTRHRLDREAALLAALSNEPISAAALTRQVYHDLAPGLLPAAERNVLAHLVDLLERNRIGAMDFPGPRALFHQSSPE